MASEASRLASMMAEAMSLSFDHALSCDGACPNCTAKRAERWLWQFDHPDEGEECPECYGHIDAPGYTDDPEEIL